MGIIGCLLSFVIVIFLVYKNWSVLLAGLAGALVCIAANGLPLWDSINDIYLSKMVAASRRRSTAAAEQPWL